MTDKEVRQLNRTQLITLLAEVSGENEELRAEVERLKEEIEKLTVTNEKLEYIGSLSRQILEKLSLRENGTARHDYLVGNEEAVSSENTEENTADVPYRIRQEQILRGMTETGQSRADQRLE